MKRMRQIWLAGLVLLSLSAEVSAQSNVAMQDSIPEIVVTGTGTEHYLKDAPVQTEVISRKMLDSYAGATLEDILSGLCASFDFSAGDMGANMQLGARTIVAALFTPLAMNVLSLLSYPSEEALHQLDPTQLLGGSLNMSDHLMLTSVIGAVVIGIGCGIVVRSRATTGGTDIVAMILQKYCHIRFSKAILLVDGIVVGFGLLVIGFGIGNPDDATQPSWHLSFYSLIAIFVTSRVLAYVINGEKNDKILFVISDMRLTALHDYILKDLDRTATCIKSSGLYTNVDKEMLFLVVSYKEVVGIKQKIREVDPKAFVVVTDAYDAFGEGWKELPMAGEVQPE